MRESEYSISSSSEVDAEELEQIVSGLLAYSELHAGPAKFRRVNLLIRNGSGVLMGGLMGKHFWNWLQIDTLWIEESVRGKGLGSRLLAQAEREAQEAGCTRALVDTFEFQAPTFYERRGYATFAVLEECPAGHQRYYLQKRLGAETSSL